ncbi:hypothetical protein TNCV_1152881 [Trichonephila clavipes]|nr:hypothetical protein TNCV_1152881 [Trichonephila clavipes]
MITNFFIPELNNHDVQELWLQQDGATCHTARATVDLLKDTFGDRLISRFGPSLVYADKPQTLDHLEDNIRRVIADRRPQMLEKVIKDSKSRLDYIRASRGSHMPEIIFKMIDDGRWCRIKLVVKVTDSWLSCHAFEPGTVENPSCRDGRCSVNMSSLKRLPADMVLYGSERVKRNRALPMKVHVSSTNLSNHLLKKILSYRLRKADSPVYLTSVSINTFLLISVSSLSKAHIASIPLQSGYGVAESGVCETNIVLQSLSRHAQQEIHKENRQAIAAIQCYG